MTYLTTIILLMLIAATARRQMGTYPAYGELTRQEKIDMLRGIQHHRQSEAGENKSDYEIETYTFFSAVGTMCVALLLFCMCVWAKKSQ